MIPKKIHYCWFGRNPLPDLAKKCIDSWKRFLPDYEIVEWNEENFDVNIIPYVAEAYAAKKYAFVSDYARFWILYHYGGLYFDTDVEIIKPLDEIIARGNFMGCEALSGNVNQVNVAPGLGLGVNPGLGLLKKMLSHYQNLHFTKPDGTYNFTTIVIYTMQVLKQYGLGDLTKVQCCADVWIYPKDYFCPLDYVTGELTITENTVSIHHYTATWKTSSQKNKDRIIKFLGPRITHYIVKLKSFFR